MVSVMDRSTDELARLDGPDPARPGVAASSWADVPATTVDTICNASRSTGFVEPSTISRRWACRTPR